MGLADDAAETARRGMWTEISEREHSRACELARRIGYARAQISEAMGYIEQNGNADQYWAYRALVRAQTMLESGS